MLIQCLLIFIIIKLLLSIKEKEVETIDFHKSTDKELRAINWYLCSMNNEPLTVNHLKNCNGFDKGLY